MRPCWSGLANRERFSSPILRLHLSLRISLLWKVVFLPSRFSPPTFGCLFPNRHMKKRVKHDDDSGIWRQAKLQRYRPSLLKVNIRWPKGLCYLAGAAVRCASSLAACYCITIAGIMSLLHIYIMMTMMLWWRLLSIVRLNACAQA